MTTPAAAADLIRSRSYAALLTLAAIIGVRISAMAYFFLDLVSGLQHWIYSSLPAALGFHGAPIWWPVPPLAAAGLLVGLTIRHRPGTGGHSPVDGLSTKGAPSAAQLPGALLAAPATLGLGAVLGPEAPLIALGGGGDPGRRPGGRRPGGRRAGDRLRGRHGPVLHRGAVLRPVGAAVPGGTRRRLLGGRLPAAALQGPGLRVLARQLPPAARSSRRCSWVPSGASRSRTCPD